MRNLSYLFAAIFRLGSVVAGGNGQDEYTDEELLVVEVLSCLKSLCTISSKACNLEESSKASCVGLKKKIRSVIGIRQNT